MEGDEEKEKSISYLFSGEMANKGSDGRRLNLSPLVRLFGGRHSLQHFGRV
jgi:hypothetical protein